ncbi:MAG: hypothetical protein V1915_02540 [Candidatus Bathyarchaeota archaeon]
MGEHEWSVVVLKFNPENVKDIVTDFYKFVDHLVGVKSTHFLISDRIDNMVVFSFRVLLETEEKKHIEDIIAIELKDLLPEENFAINPGSDHPLHAFVQWPWRDRVKKDGLEKFSLFYSFLAQLSRITVEMAEKNYFNSEERVEMAHLASGVLGCTEYGLLCTKEMRVGYYDRIKDTYIPYLSMTL